MTTPTQYTQQALRALEDWQQMAMHAWEAQTAVAQDSVERALDLSQAALAQALPQEGEGVQLGAARPTLPALDRDVLTAVAKGYAEFVNRAMSLSVEYADDLARLAQNTATRVLHEVQGEGRPAGGRPAIPVLLRGTPGSTLVTRVTLANHHSIQQQVTFEPGPVIGPSGSFAPMLGITPSTLTLGADEEGTVELTLELPAERYEPGNTYSCDVRVHGGDEAVLALSVQVEATSGE